MAKRRSRRKRGDARLRLVHSDEVQQRHEVASEMQPLMQEIRSRMRDRDPISLLSFVSTMVAATDGRHGFEDDSSVALVDLVDSLIDVDIAETTAALHGLTVLAPTEAMRARVRSALDRRRQPMPRWLDDLHETTVTTAGRVGFRGEPGQNLLIEYRWPGGQVASYVVFDEGLGRGVKDAFPSPDSVLEIAQKMRDSAPLAAALTYEPLDLATARATIEQGLVNGAHRPIDEENETWPSGRPLVEWLLSLMPSGGTPHPSTTSLPGLGDLPFGGSVDTDPEGIIDDFAESDEAAAIHFDAADVHDYAAIEVIIDYAGMLGVRDPLTWDAEGVHELLEAYLPSLVLPDPTTARRIQAVLEAFLTFAARQTHQSDRHRGALLRAVRKAMPGYLEIALSAQAQTLRQALIDYDELTEGLGDFDLNVIGEGATTPGELAGEPADDLAADGPRSLEEELLFHYLAQVAFPLGGLEALDTLDDTPLPDEELDLTDVAADIRPTVESVSRLVDGFADKFLGIEFRTAARRFLARAAAGDPSVFRRSGRADTAAAAVAWAVARGNELISAPGTDLSVQDLTSHFGTKASPSTRAQALIDAVDSASYGYGGYPSLGSADLLVSSMRAGLLELYARVTSGQIFPSR